MRRAQTREVRQKLAVSGVSVELDSRRWHNTRDGFESDRERSNDLIASGWRVIRITWRMLHDRPERVVALVRRALCDERAR